MTEVTLDQTPPLLHGPSAKEKKYDRQLRLWAASGQQALEEAHILLVNSGSGTVGVEALKNLVLPGIGKFTIADDVVVEEADLGVNFFLDEECLGLPRSDCCVKLLQELNPDVAGESFNFGKDKSFVELFENQKFTLIMYTLPMKSDNLASIRQYTNTNNIPALAIHSAGFYSYFKTHLPGSFPIVDTHPDTSTTTDLRLLDPWPELSDFATELTKNLEDQSAHDHGHIPYIAILLYYLAKWKEEHGSAPSTYKDKTLFRTKVAAGTSTDNAEGGEENFEEAVSAVLKTVSSPSLSSSVREVFDYKPDETESRSSFWIIAEAVKAFHAKHNALPLPGSVPDMKAQSTVYVRLQNIYKAKARQDAAEVLQTVRSHVSGKDVPAAEVEIFCKNAAFIKLIHGTSSTNSISEIAKAEFANDESAAFTMMPLSLLPIYLSLTTTSHADLYASSDIVSEISKDIPKADSNPNIIKAAKEVARAKGGELHNISAMTGGMVAQEVIKIITKQYIPIDNTCILDGITSRTQVLRT